MSERYVKYAEELLLDLLSITGLSGQETEIMDRVEHYLRRAGAKDNVLSYDTAHEKIPFGGSIGNLILRLPGTEPGPRRLIMAHVDTVPICAAAKPVRKGAYLVPEDSATALGGDDRAGTAVILAAALHLLRDRPLYPPITFLWTVQEEIGLYGAQFVNLAMLGKPEMAFNFDGGPSEKLAIGATGGYRMAIEVRGKASHAGAAPEKGISAITIASLAIGELHAQGWLGKVEKPEGTGTANVGVIHGGQATNVITPTVQIRAEARSHDPSFRQQIITAMETAFRDAAAQVTNHEGEHGFVTFDGRLDYESFCLPGESQVIATAETAIRANGGQPLAAISNGGLDANWMTAHGIPTVTLGCGQENPHTPAERLDLAEFGKACLVARYLATNG